MTLGPLSSNPELPMKQRHRSRARRPILALLLALATGPLVLPGCSDITAPRFPDPEIEEPEPTDGEEDDG